MLEIHHLNCVKIVSPLSENVCGHCLLLKENDRLVLIDTGIGLLDIKQPEERIGQPLIDLVGYRFNESQTAIRQIEQLGLDPGKVTDCIVSHLDNDHIGGLADFPQAIVHVAEEEWENFHSGNPRYLQAPLAHHPVITTYSKTFVNWFGFEARKVNSSLRTNVFLVPLFGHTLGHCGVLIEKKNGWLFYIADAYYLRLELYTSQHPVNELAKMRADDNEMRIATLNKIRKLVNDYPEIEVFGYHDMAEYELYRSQPSGKTNSTMQ